MRKVVAVALAVLLIFGTTGVLTLASEGVANIRVKGDVDKVKVDPVAFDEGPLEEKGEDMTVVGVDLEEGEEKLAEDDQDQVTVVVDPIHVTK